MMMERWGGFTVCLRRSLLHMNFLPFCLHRSSLRTNLLLPLQAFLAAAMAHCFLPLSFCLPGNHFPPQK